KVGTPRPMAGCYDGAHYRAADPDVNREVGEVRAPDFFVCPMDKRKSPLSRGYQSASLFVGVGILAATQPETDGGPRHVEGFAQPIRQIALIGRRHHLWARSEYNKAWRPRLGLRHVAQLETAPGHGRRRMALGHGRQPAVELGRRNVGIPDALDLED